MGDLRKSLGWCLDDELEEVLMEATKEQRPEGQKVCVTYISNWGFISVTTNGALGPGLKMSHVGMRLLACPALVS